MCGIGRMQEMCTQRHTSSALQCKRTVSDTILLDDEATQSRRVANEYAFYGVAAQMKILMSIPEQVTGDSCRL